MTIATCPDADTLAHFLLGEIGGETAEILDGHVAGCSSCGDHISRLQAEDDLVWLMRRPSSVLATIDSAQVDALLSRLRASGAEGPDAPSAPEFLDSPVEPEELGRLGPYRVLRELGRGGMGIVYAAEDPRLGRQVALKVIRDARLDDPHSRARFEQEAASLARLSHPNIVQVHEAGVYRGRPYLALEYVPGGTLADRFQGRPQSPAFLAGLVAAVADAVQLAHERGVFHRDLKPANILLGPQGTPKVADFGLARQPGDEGVTLTEDLLGTPAYMAPEMTRGGAARAAAGVDIYSLGAVLYEGLTGRPPFRGETLADTLEQVRTLDAVPPRRLQPKVPRDLEVICLKCLEKEPPRRYASAAALADDLRRVLDGRPIAARPAGPIERLQKWARRKPAWAALAGVSLLAVVALIGVAARYERSLRKEVQRANHNADEARREKDRAGENYRGARDAMAKMLNRFAAPGRADLPRVRELRRAQQEDALAFYLQIAAQAGDDPAVRHDVARAHLEAGNLQSQLGRRDDARENLRKAIDLLRGLIADQPNDEADYRRLLAECLSIRSYLEEPIESRRTQEEALSQLEAVYAVNPKPRVVRSTLARMHHQLGTTDYLENHLAEADKHFTTALDLRRVLLAEDSNSREQRLAIAQTQTNQLMVWGKLQRPSADVERLFAEVSRSLEDLLKEDSSDPIALIALAALRVNWTYRQIAEGRASDALDGLGRVIVALESFLKREPDLVDAREKLYSAYGTRAIAYDNLKRYADAAVDYRRVIELAPAEKRSVHRSERALLLIQAKDHAGAVDELEKSLTEPTPLANATQLTSFLDCCRMLIDTPQRDRAIAVARKAIETARTWLKPAEWSNWLADLRRSDALKPFLARPEIQPLLQ